MDMNLNTQTTQKPKKPVIFHFAVVALCTVLLVTFTIIANIVKDTKVGLDTVLRQVFVVEPQTFIFELFSIITWFGSTPGVTIFLIVMFALLTIKYRDFSGAFLLVTLVILTNELNKFLKDFFQRERPSINSAIEAIGYSFPSGHAMTGLLAYGLATYLIVTKCKSLTTKYIIGFCGILMIILLGISRVILSAHYPTDIIAGHMMGMTLLIVAIYLNQWLSNIVSNRRLVK
ncbi:phosphatase PAP2 family protein [Bacillus spongiae]|uniref:Phosphatase PAP2 family protein n=1 Tax=Bacillus spongiae TaxID=2683610 RepID=A0ABU8HCW3_9BACI